MNASVEIFEQFTWSNGIELCFEEFGDRSNPTFLIIAGHGTPGVAGPDAFIDLLLTAGHHIVRLDNRDVGRSTRIDYETSPYTLSDMAQDLVGLLDALGLANAHVVGGSMGGMIAQELAIEHPERVLTLTSFMSTPAKPDSANPPQWSGGLPGPSPSVLEFLERSPQTQMNTPDEQAAYRLEMFRLLGGTRFPFDEVDARAQFARQIARSPDQSGVVNHGLAIAASRDRSEFLSRLRVPTLVIHGTDDPLIPFQHAVATSELIPGAHLLPIRGLGHEFPPAAFSLVAEAIVSHASRPHRGGAE